MRPTLGVGTALVVVALQCVASQAFAQAVTKSSVEGVTNFSAEATALGTTSAGMKTFVQSYLDAHPRR